MTNVYEAKIKLAECKARLNRVEKQYKESGKEMFAKIANDQKTLIAHYTNVLKHYEEKYGWAK